jgi:uncharacterized protein YbjQ (UPF0145 family)
MLFFQIPVISSAAQDTRRARLCPDFIHHRNKESPMLLSTTPTLEGKRILEYHGVVSGDAIIGVNIFRDLFARVRDIIGGRAAGYEKALQEAKAAALADMADEAREKGANAVVGIDLDYETVGESMLMVAASGTAVTVA